VSEQMTQLEFTQALQSMFASKGWLRCFKPELERIRAERIQGLVYNFSQPDDIMAAREAIVLLDDILFIEERIKQAAAAMRDNPQEAVDVVNSAEPDLFEAENPNH
jgi:hypothetical protein